MAQKVMINGTAYELKPSPVLINGTKYQIGGGRTLVNGTGYDVKLKSSLTWYLNDNLGYDVVTTKIRFTTNRKHFDYIAADSGGRLNFAKVDFAGNPYNYTFVYYNKTWIDIAYRTITFDEEPTGDLLAWLNAHGTNV